MKYIFIGSGIILISLFVSLFFYFSNNSKEDCFIQIFHEKGPLFEKMKEECKTLTVINKEGNIVEILE